MLEFGKLLRSKLGSTVRTVLAHVAAFGMDGDDERAEQAEDCEVVQPLGFVSRPVPGADTEVLFYRDGSQLVVLGFVHKNSTLHDCEEGESQVYSDKEPTCRIRFRATGKIEMTAKSGQDIVLNGGTAKVGRVGDSVTLKNVAFSPGTGGATLAINSVNITVAPVDVPGGGVIAAGANNVKA